MEDKYKQDLVFKNINHLLNYLSKAQQNSDKN